MKIDKIRIYFGQAISGADWQSIITLYKNSYGRNFGGFLVIKMDDTLYKEVEIKYTNPINKSLLFGIIYGYTRIQPIFEYRDKFGYRIE